MIEVQPPNPYDHLNGPRLFLAGSIEMGSADDWQARATAAFADHQGVILNPRRDDFNRNAVQSIENDYFRRQVEWELGALEDCDAVLMYFDPATRSPITLLELGLFGLTGKLVVVCPEGFWRKGNVDVVCSRYHIKLCGTFEGGVSEVKERLGLI